MVKLLEKLLREIILLTITKICLLVTLKQKKIYLKYKINKLEIEVAKQKYKANLEIQPLHDPRNIAIKK